MSIVDRDKFVGRLDPVMDREHERLVVKEIHVERTAVVGRAQAARIAVAIED